MRILFAAAFVAVAKSFALAYDVSRPPLVTREEWGSKAQPIPESRKQTPVWITIHHAGELWKPEQDPAEFVRRMQIWGQNRPKIEKPPRDTYWPDLPYHFLIAPDGRIFEGRPVEYEPESNTQYSLSGNIGVEMMGDFNFQRPSVAQLRAVIALTAWLAQRHKIDLDHVRTHKDAALGQTDCPGADFYRYLTDGRFKGWVRDALANKPVTIEPDPSLPDGPFEPILIEGGERERREGGGPLVRRYVGGETRRYEISGTDSSSEGARRWTSSAVSTAVKDADGVFRERFQWTTLERDGAAVPLTRREGDVQMLSLDPRAPSAIPDLSKVDAPLISSMLDTMTFYGDEQLAIKRGLRVPGDRVYVKHGKANSWADGRRIVAGYDCVDFEATLKSVDTTSKRAAVLVRHVPPIAGCEKAPAEWMRKPEPIPPSDTPWPYNWFQVEKKGDWEYEAGAGREIFDVELQVELESGSIVSATMDNPVALEWRTCKDAALSNCGAPKSEKIVRKVRLTRLDR